MNLISMSVFNTSYIHTEHGTIHIRILQLIEHGGFERLLTLHFSFITYTSGYLLLNIKRISAGRDTLSWKTNYVGCGLGQLTSTSASVQQYYTDMMGLVFDEPEFAGLESCRDLCISLNKTFMLAQKVS